MTSNQELAEIFRSIADILDLQGERFKPEAYRRAARSIETLAEDIRRVDARGELEKIPGVGEAIAQKIREYLTDGKIGYYERVQKEVPAGVLEIMRLPGVGPKTAGRFLIEFGIEGPQELSTALEAGRFRGVKGFGDRKVALLKEALGASRTPGGRLPLAQAWTLARRIVADLRAVAPLDRIEVAGSLRRRRESVGDLDILVTTGRAPEVLDAFGRLPMVKTVKLRGSTKETVLVEGGTQVDLRVMEPLAFGAALQYFTGSKDHNVHLRTLARDRGLKANEYGVFRGDERIAGASEEEVYAALDLPWIPPEIREDRGELELAQARRLPTLVSASDLSGDLHVHLEPTATPAEVDRRLVEAAQRGWTFLGFVLPPSREGPDRRLIDHLTACRSPAPQRAIARLGREVPLGKTATAEGVDFLLASAQGLEHPPPGAPPESVTALVHLSLARAGAEATPEATRAWVDWAKTHAVALEVSPAAAADGLDSAGVRRAGEAGLSLHLTAGIQAGRGELDGIELSLGLARRGWLGPERLVNRELPAAGRPTPPRPAKRSARSARPR